MITHGRLVPCDSTGEIVDSLYCNKDLCWKGAYCWQCRLQSGSKGFQVVSNDDINNVVCEGEWNSILALATIELAPNGFAYFL